MFGQVTIHSYKAMNHIYIYIYIYIQLIISTIPNKDVQYFNSPSLNYRIKKKNTFIQTRNYNIHVDTKV